jgi:hypothetical protein
MARQCTVCHTTYPDDLKYCPHCGAWGDAPSSPHIRLAGDKSSSGEILLDPMQPDLVTAGGSAPSSGGEDIIEIDWEEVEAALPETAAPPQPGDSGVRGKPTQVAAGSRPPTQLAQPGDIEAAPSPAEERSLRSSSADFELGEAPASPQDELVAVEPDSGLDLEPPTIHTPGPRHTDSDEVDISHADGGDGGSEVRLVSEPPRPASRPSWAEPTGAEEAAAADSGESILDEVPTHAEAAESSAIDLGSGTASVGTGTGRAATPTADQADEWDEFRSDAADEELAGPVSAGVARAVPVAPAARPPSSAGPWLGGGIIGAALGVAACLGGLWTGGYLRTGSPSDAAAPEQRPPEARETLQPPTPAPAATANVESPRALLDRGDLAAAATAPDPDQGPDRAGQLAARGEARWLTLLRQRGKSLPSDDPALRQVQADLQQAGSAEAVFWLGQIKEQTGDPAGARQTYAEGLRRFPGNRLLETAVDRLEVMAPVQPAGQTGARPRNPSELGKVLGLLIALQAGTGAESPDAEEAGAYFWKAARLASQQKYADALRMLDKSRTVHDERRLQRLRKSQNPTTDPTEEIFLRACDELKTYWRMQERLQGSGYPELAKADPLRALDRLLTDAREPRPDPAVAAALERLQRDPDVGAGPAKDLGQGIDRLMEAKRKAQEQLAGVRKALQDAAYLSAEQPDVAVGLERLLKDYAVAMKPNPSEGMAQVVIDRLKKDKDVAGADPEVKDVGKDLDFVLDLKNKAQQQLAALQRGLKEANYVTADQPDPVKGLDQVLKDQAAAVGQAKKLESAMTAAVERLKKDKDVTAADPGVEDVAKGVDLLAASKKKLDDQLAAIRNALQSAKYVSPDQPDALKGVENLLKDHERVGETPVTLAAASNVLRAARYVTDGQPNVAKGVERLVADKKMAEERLSETAEKLQAADRSLKDATARLKAAEDRAEAADGRLQTADARSKEISTKLQKADDALKGASARLKTAEERAQAADAQLQSLDARYKQAAARLQKADDTLRETVARLKTAEDRAQAADGRLQTADARSNEAAAKVQKTDDALREATARLKGAEDRAQAAGARQQRADERYQEAAAKLKSAEETLRDVAAALAAARVVDPDARGAVLVRGIERVIAGARAGEAAAKAAPPGRAAVAPPRAAETLDPADSWAAERHFLRGLSNFWAGRYWAAENDFFDAVRSPGGAGQDARFYYFLGLTELAQGKLDEAREVLRYGGQLERDHRPASAVVSRALERVQGNLRRVVEGYRP